MLFIKSYQIIKNRRNNLILLEGFLLLNRLFLNKNLPLKTNPPQISTFLHHHN